MHKDLAYLLLILAVCLVRVNVPFHLHGILHQTRANVIAPISYQEALVVNSV